MRLAKLLKHYHLTPQQLTEILGQHDVQCNLRLTTSIPSEWNELLSQHTGIELLIEDKEPTPRNVENKKDKEQQNTNTKLRLKKAKRKPREANRDDYFVAYVKFIASDKSHGFVKKVDEINRISSINLRYNDSNDYSLGRVVERLKQGQLIICAPEGNDRNRGRTKRAQLITEIFSGTLMRTTSGFLFTDWISLNKPLVFSNNFNSNKESELPRYASLRQFYSYGSSTYEFSDNEVKIELIRSSISQQFIESIQKVHFEELDKRAIDAYKWQVELSEFNEIVRKQFQQDLLASDKLDQPDHLSAFIKKWSLVDDGFLSYELLKEKCTNDELWNYWSSGLLPFSFWGPRLVQVILSNNRDKSLSNSISAIYKGMLSEEYQDEFEKGLELYFETHSSIDTLNDYENLIRVAGFLPEAPKEEYIDEIRERLAPKLQVENWLCHRHTEFPRRIALRCIGSFDLKTQEILLWQLMIDADDKVTLSILSELQQLEDQDLIEYLYHLVIGFAREQIQPLCFDIESDGDDIFELAFGDGQEWDGSISKSGLELALSTLKNSSNQGDKLFIGQNIIDFDLPILEKYAISISKNRVWDTMLVEMFMSPEFKTFALKTAHHAINDAKLTSQLFFNQLFRILKLEQEQFDSIIPYFATGIGEKIKQLRIALSMRWLPDDYLTTRRSEFFRPQPKSHPIITPLKQELAKYSGRKRIIIGPMTYAKDLLSIKEIAFQINDTERDHDFSLVSPSKVDDLPDANQWSTIVLKRFLSDCEENKIEPYWGNLAVAIQQRLVEEPGLEFILEDRNEKSWTTSEMVFSSVTELKNNISQIREINNLEIFVLDPDLLSVSHKDLLKEISFTDFQEIDDVQHFWMKFSGGQSIVGLSNQQALKFVGESKSGYSNYWLEKYQFGKYRIFGNHNWEQVLRDIPNAKINTIHLNSDELTKKQVYFCIVTAKSTKSSRVVRYNPETIYRSRYWVYQKMLIGQIVSTDSPAVLLVQRADEVSVLEKYFSSLGYFVPEQSIPLGRRLEFLHSNKSYKKILIAATFQVGKILHANYLGPLTIIVDSFYLSENRFVADGSRLLMRMMTQSAKSEVRYNEGGQDAEAGQNNNEDEFSMLNASGPTLPLEKDIFFLMKLQLPYINFLRSLIDANDSEHKLWLLDPRITDFPAVGEAWQAEKRIVTIWDDPDSYENDTKEADKHILSVRPVSSIPFEQDEIKRLLSKTFLGEGNNWYDYQEEYLDEILPGGKDFLISLPTGGGKSLLFQAPSLFKSSFTNRLTLVITPLKALMEDQVKELWNKGFIGSVDYINSDRSSDLQLIYRSLAGGELSLLYITPERFRSRAFLNALGMRLQTDGGLEYVVFDEAHCVSQWGHEFRPDYLNGARMVCKIRQESEQRFPVLLFSATVSEKVYNDFNLIFHD